jgi:hypothetical protein
VSAPLYFSKISKLIEVLGENSMPDIQKAAELMANSISAQAIPSYQPWMFFPAMALSWVYSPSMTRA